MAEVILKDVSKVFGKDNLVFNDLNLDIKDKEFFTIVGPSGCGKSTVLNLIAGLEEVTSGEIFFDGLKVNDLPPAKRDVAMVFQSYALYPHKNVSENIAFPLKMKKTPRGEIQKKVLEISELLGIGELLERKPRELSGGQRQRVALGRALVRKPKVFLLDEPLSNLDAKLRVYMRAELKRLHSDIQVTTIYVTHDQAEAMSLSDRVAILTEAKIQQCDVPNIIYNFPANKTVAEFIGSPGMNFFEGKLKEVEQKAFIDFEEDDLFLIQSQLKKFKIDKNEILFGIRPENIRISQKRGEDSFEGEIFAIEPLGDRSYVDILWKEKRLKAEVPPDFSGKINESVFFKFEPDKFHLFDKYTGQSLRL
ncbi:MAG: ABC transporter ATP-binding protein [Candidatus Zixiibacteriota bacterium]